MSSSVLGHAASLMARQSVANESGDKRIASATETSSSIPNFLSALVFNVVLFSVFFLLFLILRKSNRRIYAPRTYVGTIPEHIRRESASLGGQDGFLSWIPRLVKMDDTSILRSTSLDGYFFLRYLRKAQLICFIGCCITLPILLPITITGGVGQEGFDLLAFGNVSRENKNRYYAHVLVGYVFFGFVLYTIYRELLHFVALRQAYMLSPNYRNRISARTVLFTAVPEEYMNEATLRRVFDNVKRIWLNTDTTEVEELVKERDQIALKLEAGEVKLIKLTDAARRKHLKSNPDADATPSEGDDGESGSVSAKWLDRKNRPTHALKFLVVEKVDTIDWCRGRLAELNPQVEELQHRHKIGEAKKFNSAFIEFTTQSAAQVAVQTVAHNSPLTMAPRYIGVTPSEVVWSNMNLNSIPRLVKIVLTTAFIVALVIFWSIPVAVVGTISQINYLTEQLPFLDFINSLPPAVLGIITSVLPTVALAVLMALLPIILRLMARIAGAPSLSEVELKTQNSYFTFQVVQVFLITTLSAAVSASLQKILDSPSDVAPLLAENIPKASNFYIAFMILQGLTIAGGAVLQIVGLILFKLLGLLLDNTPRKMWRRWANLSGLGWGTVFPIYTNMAVIALTYSIIAPIVMFFAVIGFGLLGFAYRYNILFVYNSNIDTKGMVYPRALYQTLTGVYLAQICLIGLFALNTAVGPLVLQVAFLVFTVLFQIGLSNAVQPLLSFLPKNLEDIEDAEAEREAELERGVTGTGGVGSAAPQIPEMEDSGHLSASAHNKELPESTENGVDQSASSTHGAPTTDSNPGMFARFFHPEKYETYMNLRKVIPKPDYTIEYTPEEEAEAYFHPAVKADPPVLWLPKDPAGVSAQECKHTSEVIECFDDEAIVDENGKIRRVEETSVPPKWRPEPLY